MQTSLEKRMGDSVPEPLTLRPHALKSGADWLVSEPPEVAESFLEGLSEHALAALPYAPAHLRVGPVVGGQQVSFVRRTRIDGDRWDLAEVPLGESVESYLIRISAAGSVLRETNVTSRNWTYTDVDWSEDGAHTDYEIAVAQLSDRYGPGPFARRTINA